MGLHHYKLGDIGVRSMDRGKIAFIFPGQGAQYIGMGKEIAENFPSADRVFDEADEALGFSVRDMVFYGAEDALKITQNTQPAILTASMACVKALEERGIKPDIAAGLSLGEYGAHVVSGTFSFEDALRLVRKRGKYMQEAVPEGTGITAAILGLEDQAVIECCQEVQGLGVVEPVNFNCPGQVVISGNVRAVEKAMELAGQKGAKRVIVLPVSAPFHCSLLRPAGERLAQELEKIEVHKMNIPVVANTTAEYIKEDEVKDSLVRQVSSPVLWAKSVKRMLDDRADTFIEVGPGKVLSGFMKKIAPEGITVLNVENMETLNTALERLGV